jgi:hypothetical protein
METCEVAAAAGILVIAENANWRDADELGRLGISAGTRLRADA